MSENGKSIATNRSFAIESLEPMILLSASCGGAIVYAVDPYAADWANACAVEKPDTHEAFSNDCFGHNKPHAYSWDAKTVDCDSNERAGCGKAYNKGTLGNSKLVACVDSYIKEDFKSPARGKNCDGSDHQPIKDAGCKTYPLQGGVKHGVQEDAVLAWNNLLGDLLVSEKEYQNPGYASRAMAMMNVAIYDAITIASGDSGAAFYEHEGDVAYNAKFHRDIVAGQAAYTVLSSLFSDQQDTIDSFRSEFFADLNYKCHGSDSIELGTTAGEKVLAERLNDKWDAVVDYSYDDQLGKFQADPLNPDVPAWGPGWGEVTPFAISSVDDFSPESAPPLTSQQYADSYNEAKELGAYDSHSRTADQTEAGIFWAYDRSGLGTPMHLFGDVLETIAIQQCNTTEENAALFASASVSMADAGIVAWDTKFSDDFWRPVTAIQTGDEDGNPLTYGDPHWTPLGAPDGDDDIIGFTPPFPTYISGHATFGGALFTSIREFYGTDDIAFDLKSRELEILMDKPHLQAAYGLNLNDATRSFDSLSEAMAENGRSRVYLGIHFDFDDLKGQEVGQAIAESVSQEFVVPSAVKHHYYSRKYS